MAMSAPRLIALASTNHDDRTVPQRRLAVHQALIPGRRAAAYNADRLELVHHLGDAHERRHRTEGHPAEIDVGTRENDADPLVGEVVCDIDDPVIQELGFVDRDHPYGGGGGRGEGGWGVREGRESPVNLRIFGGYPIVLQCSCGFSRPPFKEIAVNKAELTSALAMRTKMSKADATRTVEALFDDKGIIASELKKGSKVQITGFGNFEARKRAARMGRNPKTGGVIQIKASIAPAFRAGKQLKLAVNGKK